ncbi:MAG: glycosyltransferase family 4 protein [Candidatus Kariarchaeaceae archaeon]|jgi:glycosyltransferase involved in cell wall biosynthesis
MKIGIFHGYELVGSGSNQSTSYLAKSLAKAGHEVHILCREPSPESIDFIDKAIQWDSEGASKVLFEKETNKNGVCIIHQLPLPPINAVYINDTQRPGNVKAFSEMTDQELKEYHRFVTNSLRYVLKAFPVEILQTNHIIYQPVVAAEVCEELNIPFVIYPRGSAIEYTVRHDNRYKELALSPILKASCLIVGNQEVRDRITDLYPEYRDEILSKTEIVGLGVDTSLFSPVKIKQRKKSIENIYSYAPFGGKFPKLTEELYSRLDKGDIYSISDYREAYQIKQPDSNLIDKLEKIPWESNILLFVGATIAGKGLQTLIVALPFILKQNPDSHLVFVGSGVSREIFEALVYAIATKNEKLLEILVDKGFDFDPAELTGPWTDVKSFLSNNKNKTDLFNYGSDLLKHVHFLGRLDHNILRYVFPCADVGLFPSIIPEAYGNVLFESLANGVLPMATYFSGLAVGMDNLIQHLGQELIDLMKIPIDDSTRIPGLIKNLTHLLSDSTLESISLKLRKIAVENYDWDIRAKQMVSTYSKFVYSSNNS